MHRQRPGVTGIAVLLVTLFFALLCAPGAASADQIADKKAEAARLASQINAQGDKLSQLDEQMNRATLRAQAIEADQAKAQDDLARTQQRAAQAVSALRVQAVAAYVHGGTIASKPVIASDARDSAIQKQYISTLASQQRDVLDAVRQARQDLAARQAALASARAQARSALAQVASARDAAARADAGLQATLDKTKGELAQLVAQEQARQAAAAESRARAAQAAAAARNQRSASRGPSAQPSGPPPPVGSGASAAIAEARRQIGKPYRYGAAGPDSFDCSGLVMWSWRAGGRSLPHSTYAQWDATTRVAISDLQPGDIVFFGSDLHHDGLYIGNGQMIEAPHSGAYVRYASIYRSDLYGGGRVN
ncbi:MAG: peptidoglycan DL-endopeptidase CwlO [Actinomycetota bacterium]|nr:peptidoglycan DL-endopeptidase CwlO [Actinomycetota bacterium]